MICCKEKLKYVLHYVRKTFKDYSIQYKIFDLFGLLSLIFRNVAESYSHLLYSYKHHVCFKKVEAYLRGRVIHKYHDVDKIVMYALFPWLGVECINHIHTLLQNHHPCYKDLDDNKAYKPKDEVEWTEAVVDWECARFTKPDKPLNAYDTYLKYYYTSEYTGVIINTLISLGLLSVKTTDAGVVYEVTDKMGNFKYK